MVQYCSAHDHTSHCTLWIHEIVSEEGDYDFLNVVLHLLDAGCAFSLLDFPVCAEKIYW